MSSIAVDTNKKIKKKSSRKPIAVLCILVLLAGAWYAYDKNKKAKQAEADITNMYQTQMAAKGNVYVTVTGSGTVEAHTKASVVPKVSGDIAKIYKTDGDYVKAGEVIAELDPSEYSLKYKQAEADLSSAQANLNKAIRDAKLYPTEAKSSVEQAKSALLSAQQNLNELLKGAKPQDIEQQKSAVRQQKANYDNANADYKRMKDLYDQGAISKQQLEQAEVKSVTSYEQYLSAKQKLDSLTEKASKDDVAAARAQVNQAQANLKLAQSNAGVNTKQDAVAQAQTAYETAKVNLETARKNLNSVRITAPISGVLWGFTSVVGDSVSQQSQSMPLASVIDTSKLQASIAVDEADIQKVAIGQQAKITTDALEDMTFMGTVSKIAPEATVVEGISTYEVIINIDQSDSALKPGMNADTEILLDWAENVITVPVSAVMDRNGRKTIMVMDGKEPSYRRVTVGKSSDSLVEVQSGISQGDMVVTNPNVASQTSDSTQQSGNGSMGMRMGGFMGGGFRR